MLRRLSRHRWMVTVLASVAVWSGLYCVPPQAAAQCVINQWRSVRTNSSLGELNIVLNPTADGNGTTGPTVESRGTTALTRGIQKIQVVFSSSATLANSDGVSVSGQTTTYPGGVATLGSQVSYTPASVVMSSSTTLDILFNPGQLPDETCYTIALAPNTIAEGLIGDLDVNVRSLSGDGTGNGEVDLGDFLATRTQFYMETPAASAPQFDYSLSGGTISNADVLYCKSRIIAPARAALCAGGPAPNPTGLTATLRGPGNVSTLQVPTTGGTFDISVNLARNPDTDPQHGAMSMDFAAGGSTATLNGFVNSQCSTGTGTRFNSPEWVCGGSFMPSAGALSATARGVYGTLYGDGYWITATSLMGYANVTFAAAPAGTTYVINPVNVKGFDANLDTVPGQGVGLTIQYVCSGCRTVTQWRSIRTHGTTVGDIGIVLNATATGNAPVAQGGPNVETRGGIEHQPLGIARIQVDFNGAATAPNAALITVTGYSTTYPGDVPTLGAPVAYTPNSAFMVDSDTMEMTFSPFLPDQSCYVISLGQNVVAETIDLSQDYDVVVRALSADVTLSGTVTNSDILLVKAKFNANTPLDNGSNAGNAIYDVGLSGAINNGDVLLVKARFIAQTYTRSALCP